MDLPRIFNYEHNNLTLKNSFKPFEKGIFGIFYEDWGGYSLCHFNKNNLIIFAPNQKEFEHAAYCGKVQNHRFLNFLECNVESLRKDKEIFTKELKKRIYRGGKRGEYTFQNDVLSLNPLWENSEFKENSRSIGELLRLHKDFHLNNYKISQELSKLII